MSRDEIAGPLVAVVIPYFQRRPGILRAALTSIVGQNLPAGVRVACIIVDDGSPVPADGELPELERDSSIRFDVVRQSNGGVSAARNAALDAVPERASFIAYLDSDDVWEPDHIASALGALSAGADIYFANNALDEKTDWFGTMPEFRQMLEARKQADRGRTIHLFDARTILPDFLADCPSHTSTVVHRREPFRNHRFDLALRSAGEDHLYWFGMVSRAATVAVNLALMGRRGHGIDLYRSAQSWDSPDCLQRLSGNLLKQKRIAGLVEDAPELASVVERQVEAVRQELLIVLLRSIARYPRKIGATLAFLLRHDRGFFARAAPNGLALWRRKRLTGSYV